MGTALAVWVGPKSAIACFAVGVILLISGQLKRQTDEADGQGGSVLGLSGSGSAVAGGTSSNRRIEVKNRLGELHPQGEEVLRTGDKTSAEQWATEAHNFIEEALGSGEAALFLSDAGYVFYSSSKPDSHVKNWVRGRLQRLASLIERSDTISIK